MPNIRELAKAELPFRDKPVNVLSIGDWWGVILGAAVVMVSLALAKPLFDAISRGVGRVPFVGDDLGGYLAPAPPVAELPVPGLRVLQ